MAHVAPKQGAPEPVCRVDATKSSHDLTVAKAQIQLLQNPNLSRSGSMAFVLGQSFFLNIFAILTMWKHCDFGHCKGWQLRSPAQSSLQLCSGWKWSQHRPAYHGSAQIIVNNLKNLLEWI
jgi:hypothetical protein